MKIVELATKILSRSKSLDHAISSAETLSRCCHTSWDMRRYESVVRILKEMKNNS